jgi:DNA-directed RNA polymerase subunit RPC12/RpoP
MRRFKCAECGHELEISHGTGGAGRNIKCPRCGGAVHRVDAGGPPEGRGFSQGAGGRGRGQRAGQRSEEKRDDASG